MLTESLKQVKSKDDFIDFLNTLSKDWKANPVEWENKTVDSYIEAIQSWTEDMDGYYTNTKQEIPQNIDWNFIATLLYVGKIYE